MSAFDAESFPVVRGGIPALLRMTLDWQAECERAANYARWCVANDNYLPRVRQAQNDAAEAFRQMSRFRDRYIGSPQ